MDQGAVHVDETGWRTSGEGRALWTATTPGAVFFQIAEHCNREQFNALIGTSYPGIVVSDRWNGYSHLDPDRRQVCWSHLQRDFRRHADGLAEQKTFGEQGLQLTDQVFAAWRAYQHEHHDRDRLQAEIAPIQTELRALLEDASPEEGAQPLAPPVRQQPAQGLARALDLHHHRRGRADQQPRRTRAPRPGHPPKTLARHPKPQRRTLRRTRPLRRRHLPPTTPLAVHLPQRTPRRPQPRRPVPRAHLSGPGTERLLTLHSGCDITASQTRGSCGGFPGFGHKKRGCARSAPEWSLKPVDEALVRRTVGDQLGQRVDERTDRRRPLGEAARVENHDPAVVATLAAEPTIELKEVVAVVRHDRSPGGLRVLEHLRVRQAPKLARSLTASTSHSRARSCSPTTAEIISSSSSFTAYGSAHASAAQPRPPLPRSDGSARRSRPGTRCNSRPHREPAGRQPRPLGGRRNRLVSLEPG